MFGSAAEAALASAVVKSVQLLHSPASAAMGCILRECSWAIVHANCSAGALTSRFIAVGVARRRKLNGSTDAARATVVVGIRNSSSLHWRAHILYIVRVRALSPGEAAPREIVGVVQQQLGRGRGAPGGRRDDTLHSEPGYCVLVISSCKLHDLPIFRPATSRRLSCPHPARMQRATPLRANRYAAAPARPGGVAYGSIRIPQQRARCGGAPEALLRAAPLRIRLSAALADASARPRRH